MFLSSSQISDSKWNMAQFRKFWSYVVACKKWVTSCPSPDSQTQCQFNTPNFFLVAYPGHHQILLFFVLYHWKKFHPFLYVSRAKMLVVSLFLLGSLLCPGLPDYHLALLHSLPQLKIYWLPVSCSGISFFLARPLHYFTRAYISAPISLLWQCLTALFVFFSHSHLNSLFHALTYPWKSLPTFSIKDNHLLFVEIPF